METQTHGVLREAMRIRYEVDVTFRCNLACPLCDRLVGKLPINNSDVTVEDITVAGERIREAGLEVSRVKVSGGEPLLHKDATEICQVIETQWPLIVGNKRVLCSNGQLPVPTGITYRKSISGLPKAHTPATISPADLGLSGDGGCTGICRPQQFCGRAFDAFGFNFCPYAGIIGRIVGIDTYSSRPVLVGVREICKHCLFTIPAGKRLKLRKAAVEGELQYPTPTFREGIDRNQDQPTNWPRFLER